METNVHYPTDINLLFDAIRKSITLTADLYFSLGISRWRQHKHNLRKIKRLFRKAQQIKRSPMKNKEKKEKLVIKEHQIYIKVAQTYIQKIEKNIGELPSLDILSSIKALKIKDYINHANRQIDQIKRRVIEGEKIPHNEKVFSIFQSHTEWINKGKAGISQELGLRVFVLEDNFGFLLHHHVMQKETDVKVAVAMIQKTKEKFPELESCSFDKGFYSLSNKEELKKLLVHVGLPKKGKKSLADKETESSDGFVYARSKHSAVESAINALENHGLDRCLDHGINGFKRYVALAVLSRNIQILGNIIQQKKLKRKQRLAKSKRKSKPLAA